jgi:hypothetical protein
MNLRKITSLWAYTENLPVEQTMDIIDSFGLRHVDILEFLHSDRLKLSTTECNTIHKHLVALDIELGSLIILPKGNIPVKIVMKSKFVGIIETPGCISDLRDSQVLFSI